MALNLGAVEEFTFTERDNLAGACAGALRKVKSLADIVPSGRLFAAITTLSDTASDIDQKLAIGALRNAAKKMAGYAEPAPVVALDEPLPIHFRKRT